MEIDLFNVLSFALAFAGILSPLLTTYFSRKMELRLKKLDLLHEATEVNYKIMLECFQEFVLLSGEIMINTDIGHKITKEKIIKFDVVCLNCFLFLSKGERQKFQKFRYEMKKSFGFSNPEQTTIDQLNDALKTLDFSQLGIKKEHVLFSECIDIAQSKLEEILNLRIPELRKKRTKQT
ncbi:hypothetical protein [Listeria newyorkensis]|uniref:hypothetical protein n=1 Tax=Listeria newyorkensis TaxID=1497681 RepID=UPI00051DD790|nr:hypothetical protein [Listeria newyorkensis]KGL45730.1 hypothetical protein EP58_03305 [Listeria newyorkensis]SQC55333.1 Uncharacterised protein [Listeria newyorkensis]